MKITTQIINKINNKLCTAGQQRKIFQETQIGDLLWCKMPLPKKQLKQIEESHRIRPYLVIEKNRTFYCAIRAQLKIEKK